MDVQQILTRDTLDLYITHATNGIKFTQLERQRLRRLRYEGHDETVPKEVTAA